MTARGCARVVTTAGVSHAAVASGIEGAGLGVEGVAGVAMGVATATSSNTCSLSSTVESLAFSASSLSMVLIDTQLVYRVGPVGCQQRHSALNLTWKAVERSCRHASYWVALAGWGTVGACPCASWAACYFC